jgi:RNA polymerase sigma factor (sigma-70 family)
VTALSNLPSLKEWLDPVLAGDEQAKQILYEEFKPPFYRYLRYYLNLKGCPQADDHSLEVENFAWFKIFASIEGLRNPESFVPWSLRIMEREALDHLHLCIKAQKTTTSLEEVQKLPPAQIYNAEKARVSSVLVDEIFTIALEISPVFALVLRLYHKEGRDFHEIAALLGESYEKVRRDIYYRGLAKLKARLKS